MADIEDIEVSDETGEPVQPLWVAPTIYEPRPGETVPPNFRISGFVDVFAPSRWRVQFFRGPDMVREMEKDGDSHVEFRAPFNIIPPGAQFYFRLDYKLGLNWSAWKYSGDLTMNMALQPPLINEPKDGSYHDAGAIAIKGTCKSGAAVSVYDFYNKKLGDASVQGTSWTYIHIFTRGMRFIRAGQKVASEDSGPGDVVSFTVEANSEFKITAPGEREVIPQNEVTVRGYCSFGAKVEVRESSGPWLDSIVVVDRRWSMPYIPWSVGPHSIIAREFVPGLPTRYTPLTNFRVT